jgi:AraC family transcriptional regulator of adaptative response/methylated-DNA-[protein]-cysteine methyltransferase
VRGTNFQIRIWKALLQITEGTTVTYGNIAEIIGQPNAARAVGNAVGSNPVAYLIPCHRVIRENGAIGGYRWSSERKRLMLAWERVRQNSRQEAP